VTQLFQRKLRCSVDANDPFGVFRETLRLDTEPLCRRITFKSTKTWRQEPNTCEVQVYNLSPEMRATLSKAKTPTLKLAAGYVGDDSLTQIFYGQTIYVKHEVKDADVITTISTTDGGEKKQQARINIAFGRGTSTGTVLRRIVAELGVHPGNVDKVAADIDKGLRANLFAEGVMISGSAANELGHLCRSVGYDYSIQDGVVQLLKIGEARDDFEVVLDPTTGLIGSPSISNKGVVSGTCLLFKAGSALDLVPGRRIKLTSRFLSGDFIIAKTESTGDNYAEDWYCQFEAVAKKGDLVTIK